MHECTFERFRGYLRLLAECELDTRHRTRLDASDVAQEVLLKAWRDRGQLRGSTDDEIAAWLRSILAHTLANLFRDMRREKRDIRLERPLEASLERSSVGLLGTLAASGSSPSSRAERLEELGRISRALEALPGTQRQAVVLRHWGGLSLREIAERMEKTTGSVGVLIHRGLGRLRRELAAELAGDEAV